MASKRTTTSTPVETIEAAAFDEALPAINDALDRFIKSVTVTSTHYRYKAIRAIAFQAFTNAIEDGTFDALVDQAIANAGDLPAGWGVEAAAAKKPAAKPAPAKKTAAAKAPAKSGPAAPVKKAPAQRATQKER
ncbi:hypothetical protein [Microbacterium sp.]|uniref:hypothetical protein n=1 Tax=Microbacterium sp. TaxID=51671 RepID=UPI003A91D0F5